MSENKIKSTSIMFTDVVGYSRMMARDEAHALDLLEEHNSIIRQSIEKYDGYIIKLIGDSVFSEFDNPELPRGKPATKVTISNGNRVISYESDGIIAGLQFSVNGIFEIIENYLPAGWKIEYNENIIILYSLDGSSLSEKTLFKYKGNITIKSSIVADWYGSDILVSNIILPKEFSLDQAYPNPFNPVTNIHYALPEDSRVSLIIYDLQGRVAAELVNDIKIAGYHSLIWNASNHASGIYFIKIQAGEYISTQKLMLLK